jgi:hypothetical protein
MGAYAQVADVTSRMPYTTLSGTSKPSTTDIERWIDEAEAKLEGAALGVGIQPSSITTRGKMLFTSWAADYAEGRARRALAAAGGDGDNDDGVAELVGFRETIDQFATDPGGMDAMLTDGSPVDDTRRVRSYVTDNSDGVTRSSSGIVPTIRKGEGDAQF